MTIYKAAAQQWAWNAKCQTVEPAEVYRRKKAMKPHWSKWANTYTTKLHSTLLCYGAFPCLSKYQCFEHFHQNNQSSGAVWKSWVPVPNSPYSLCGREATMNSNSDTSIFFRFLPALLPSPYQRISDAGGVPEDVLLGKFKSVFFTASCVGQSVYTSCLKCDL